MSKKDLVKYFFSNTKKQILTRFCKDINIFCEIFKNKNILTEEDIGKT